jgi:pimeloyl-ACP methyl ester carboxylesterase
MMLNPLLRCLGALVAAGLLVSALPAREPAAAAGRGSARLHRRGTRARQVNATAATPPHPVVALPGVGGSYIGVDDDFHPDLEGWPGSVTNAFWSDPTDVQFTQDGSPRTDTDSASMVARGLLDDMDDLLPFLSQQGLTVHPMAYDFRYSITLMQGLLQEKINRVRTKTGQEIVDLVAHSMGTLVVRQYLANHPSDSHVGRVVLIAPPNLGAPKALKAIRYGDDLGHPYLLDSCSVKRAAHNLPGLYDLLPSQRYFQLAGGYFSTTRNGGNGQILNFTQMVANLKTAAEPTDRWCPLQAGTDPAPLQNLSPQLVDSEVVAFHNALDNTPVPAGVQLFAIDGYGQQISKAPPTGPFRITTELQRN